MRHTGPKNRLSRKEGIDLGLKTASTKSHANLLKRLNVIPGQHGARIHRKVSQRRRQLSEKQKLCYMFGLSEKHLKNYFLNATGKKGNSVLLLCQALESRLDNVVYRLGFAPTRAAARQLVSHRHIKVNDNVINVPSYSLKVGDTITFAKDESAKIPYIKAAIDKKSEFVIPWIERKGLVGKLSSLPNSSLIEKQVDLRQVIEYYSR